MGTSSCLAAGAIPLFLALQAFTSWLQKITHTSIRNKLAMSINGIAWYYNPQREDHG